MSKTTQARNNKRLRLDMKSAEDELDELRKENGWLEYQLGEVRRALADFNIKQKHDEDGDELESLADAVRRALEAAP